MIIQNKIFSFIILFHCQLSCAIRSSSCLFIRALPLSVGWFSHQMKTLIFFFLCSFVLVTRNGICVHILRRSHRKVNLHSTDSQHFIRIMFFFFNFIVYLTKMKNRFVKKFKKIRNFFFTAKKTIFCLKYFLTKRKSLRTIFFKIKTYIFDSIYNFLPVTT